MMIDSRVCTHCLVAKLPVECQSVALELSSTLECNRKLNLGGALLARTEKKSTIRVSDVFRSLGIPRQAASQPARR